MSPGATVLIVDDDARIRDVVRYALQHEGFHTVEAGDGQQAMQVFDATRPELVILDILMPELDGTEVCRRLRAISSVPIIFLSSKDDELDRILGLELGGDDYVVKPFSPRELVARVRAVLRRVEARGRTPGAAGERSAAPLRHGRLRLDPARFQVSWDDRPITLTVTEFGVLRVLLERPGQVCTRDDLMRRAYPEETIVSGRTIDSHVRRVRRKFADAGGDPIETVHGLGYKIGPCR